ncbi:hypothetical protein ACWC98_32430 [Streptomyces goshikiensis]
MDTSGEYEVAEQPDGQDLARIALHNAIQGARYSRGRTHRRRSRLWSRPRWRQPVLLKVTVAEVVEHYGWPVPEKSAVVTQWPVLAGDLARAWSPSGSMRSPAH